MIGWTLKFEVLICVGVFLLLLLLLMQVYGPISSIDAVKTSSVGT